MNLIKLTASEIDQLQNCLNQSDSVISLPLRHQLWYARNGIVIDGHVYVDRWPKFKFVCSLHTSVQFVRETDLDFDVVTFYCTDEHCDAEDSELGSFLEALAFERKWKIHRSMYTNYVQVPVWLHKIQKLLSDYGRIDTYGNCSLYTILERQNIPEYRHRLAELSANLPSNFVPGELFESDVYDIIREWPYGPWNVVPDYYRWLLRTFPTVCLRDQSKNNRLIAWACGYSCGALANVYVEPEYRGRGLSEYIWLSIGMKIAHFTSVQPYFAIKDENVLSQKSSKKAFYIDQKKYDQSTMWYFYYNRNQFPGV